MLLLRSPHNRILWQKIANYETRTVDVSLKCEVIEIVFCRHVYLHFVFIPPYSEREAAFYVRILRAVDRVLQGTACEERFLGLIKGNDPEFLPVIDE